MSSTQTIVHALVLMATVTAIVAQSNPSFCRGYECPLFTAQQFDGYEIRTMTNPTHWVQTTITSADNEMSRRESSGAFRKLFNYIQGENAAGNKIPMTVPVLTKVQQQMDGTYSMTMMFYVDGAAAPPAPTDNSVEVVTLPQGAQFFAKTFFKWFRYASTSEYDSNLASMKTAINDPTRYDDSVSYRAAYESPFFFGRRRFDVWMQVV